MAIKVKVGAKFPARVLATSGLKVTKAGGTFTFEPDWASLASVDGILADDFGDYQFLAYKAGGPTNLLVPVDDFVTAILAGSVGTSVQAWDADLDALAAASGTNTIYYRSAENTWSAVSFSAPLSFSGGAVSIADAELTAIAGLTSAADTVPYFTGSGTAGLADFTSAARALLDDASVSAMRTTLELVIGTDVQAYDVELAALASVTSAADALPYFTGSGTAATTTLTAAARTVLDDATTSAMLATLGGLPLAGGTMTGNLTLAGDPSNSLHAATKQYVDSVAAGLDVKPSVLCATTANITLSGEQTLDGITTSGSRVLVKNQSTASQNGIYVSAAGAWSRATDFDSWLEIPGAFVFVERGTLYADCAFVCTADQGGTLGTTSIAWSQFAGAGTYTAGTGLTLSGTQFSLSTPVAVALGGTGAATAANARTNLGLVIGTDVQAYDADLSAVGALSSTGIPVRTASNTWALRNLSASTGLAWTNPAGIAGDPSVALDINSLTVDGSPDTAADYVLTYDASAGAHKKVLLSTLASGGVTVREILTSNRTYYVRTDGSDSNNGLANTSGGAFLTIQKAINVAATLDMGGFTTTISVATGTYTGSVSITAPFVGGIVQLQGDTTTPSNVMISTTSADAISVSGSGITLYVKGFKIQTSGSGQCITAKNGGTIIVNGNMNYGTCAASHLSAVYNGNISVTSNYTISGGALSHFNGYGAGVLIAPSLTVTLSGTPTFSVAFCWFPRGAAAGELHAVTFSGSATGSRYDISGNCVVFTNSGGASYFPGNSAGSTATGGQYT